MSLKSWKKNARYRELRAEGRTHQDAVNVVRKEQSLKEAAEHGIDEKTVALLNEGMQRIMDDTARTMRSGLLRDGFNCCGGNDEHPPHHCSDCDEHPWTGAPDPRCVSNPSACPHVS